MDLNEFYRLMGSSLAEQIERLGSERLLYRFLLRLPDDASLSELRRGIDSSDTVTVFRAAHTIKGIAMNLGLATLQNASAPLAEALRNKTAPEALASCADLIDALLAELDRAVALIRELSPAT